MSGMVAALASSVLKVAGDKLVALLATEFATITGVKRYLSELQDTHRLQGCRQYMTEQYRLSQSLPG